MHKILTKLVLDARHAPLDASLSPGQTGGPKGRTPTVQAIATWTDLVSGEAKQYVCLLDLAKALPSVPRTSVPGGREVIGTHPAAACPRLLYSPWQLDSCAIPRGNGKSRLRRGITDGCPLSPALFVLVYEAVRRTLRREIPEATFYV